MMKKKTLILLMAGAVCFSANATKTVKGSRITDNVSIGILGGGITTLNADYAFWKNMRGAAGLEVTKNLTPIFGLSVQGVANFNTSPSKTVVDATNISLLGKVNLANLFLGYKGTPRVFEPVLSAGAGWMHTYGQGSPVWSDGRNYEYGAQNAFTSKFGIDLNFNLGEAKAWTVSLKPAIMYDMNGLVWNSQSDIHRYQPYNRLDRNNAFFELFAGVTYHFKNSYGTHSFVLANDNQEDIDRLNAQINDMRGQLNDCNQKTSDLQAKANADAQKINDLQRALKDCQDKNTVKTITNNVKSLESTITFDRAKSIISNSQMPNIERVASFLKSHKDAKVDIKGYASPEGNLTFNNNLAKARAEAVKSLLVNKYKIAANRINASGEGVGKMFSENDWNRVSICTIAD